jgi:prophage regulatory protein
MLTSKRRAIDERTKSSRGHAAARVQGHAATEPKASQGGEFFSAPELCFIRLKEVLTICGKSRSSVYEAIKNGDFPAPIKVGGRSSAWVKSEVLQWAQRCIDCSRIK